MPTDGPTYLYLLTYVDLLSIAVIRSGDKYMFDELSEDEMETTSSSEVIGGTAAAETVDGATGTAGVPLAPDWREEKIGVGPVQVRA